MSRWEDQLKEHSIHANLAELKACIERPLEDTNEVESTERRRFEKIISAYTRILSKLDPEILPFNQLDSLSSSLSKQAIPQAREYRDAGNVGSLAAANDRLSDQLTQLALFYGMAGESNIESQPDSLEKEYDRFVTALSVKSKAIEDTLSNLNAGLNEQKIRINQLGEKIDLNKSETDTILSEWQQQFSQSQESRNENYATWRRELENNAQTRVSEVVDGAKSQLESFQKNHANTMVELFAKSKEDQKRIRDLRGIAAEDSVSGGYAQDANKEGTLAARWRRISVAFIVAATAWLIYNFFWHGSQISLETILIAIPTTGVLLWGAAYGAQQSTRHRNVEVHNRRFALEMAAIDPYLQTLPSEDQQALKKELTKRYFGQQAESNGTTVYDEHALKRSLEVISKHLSPIADFMKNWK